MQVKEHNDKGEDGVGIFCGQKYFHAMTFLRGVCSKPAFVSTAYPVPDFDHISSTWF